MIEITIDQKPCTCEKGETILSAAARIGVEIPTLCHHEGLCGQGVCRVCMVELVESGWGQMVAACIFPVQRSVSVFTDSEKVKKHRAAVISLLLARTPDNDSIELLAKRYNVQPTERFVTQAGEKCMVCGLCVRACSSLGTGAISTVNRGITKKIATPYDEPSAACIGCSSCANVCPTGYIDVEENDGERIIWGKKFEMIRCAVCGRHYMTKEQYDYIRKKTGADGQPICNTNSVCESCSRTTIAKKWVENTKYVYD
ncbi:MAG: (2Fe-2S)-binding protein [Treponema sp.]|jgi:NADH dehydrogenase/NADH:ubiquinone oxidoreductase subunit G|nr:(2Fe-2S)-binding protein [Treponema sp.]